MKRILLYILIVSLFTFGISFDVRAETSLGSSLSSDTYRILDSLHGLFGGTSSSSSQTYNLLGTLGDLGIGSSSFTLFGLRSGFLYFPKVVAPVLNTATAGNAQVSLAWTAATAYQGFRIASYNVCTKPSGGSYTCENVGAVVSYTKTGLTNSTTYFFQIEAVDGVGDVIAISNELSATPTGSTPPSGGGGGGGGGGYVPPTSGSGAITIKGTAYPNSTVNVYFDGSIVTSLRAGSSAKFEITLNTVAAGAHSLGLNSEDANGRRSITVTYNVNIVANTTVSLFDVLLAPTIDISATQLRRGDSLNIFGQAAPISEVSVHVQSEETITKAITDSDGAYAIRFNTQPLVDDTHTTKSRAVFEKVVSPFSQVLQFIIGQGGQLKTADLNKDGRVNIIDFSILLYWWNTKLSQGFAVADINGDVKINIVDFSIMLFQWTK